MTDHFNHVEKAPTEEHGTLVQYVIGLILSLVTTFSAYFLVTKHWLEGYILIAAIVSLAIVQASVQLICFLHLGKEKKPRWNLQAFFFMALIVILLVFGSLWIMHHLNARTMTDMIKMNMNLKTQK